METAFAFKTAGATCELVHINELVSSANKLERFHILAIPGGFTYGDDIASGKILANEIKYKLEKDVVKFIKEGKLIIGICNGFQVLVKAGFLPNSEEKLDQIEASLSINDSGKFEDRWVYLKNQKSKNKNQKCVWTKGIEEVMYLPVAHAEGKFIPKNDKILNKLKQNDQIVFRYCDESGKENKDYPGNPNGSIFDIAGICDPTGRIFGLMPHPERHIHKTQHPRWTRLEKGKADGIEIFRNGVKEAAKL